MSGYQSPHLLALVWIYSPGHSGMQGSEQADLLALRDPITRKIMIDKE